MCFYSLESSKKYPHAGNTHSEVDGLPSVLAVTSEKRNTRCGRCGRRACTRLGSLAGARELLLCHFNRESYLEVRRSETVRNVS